MKRKRGDGEGESDGELEREGEGEGAAEAGDIIGVYFNMVSSSQFNLMRPKICHKSS